MKSMKSSKKPHRKHMCVLREQGLINWVRRLSDKPVVECIYCGAQANSLRNVCAVQLAELTPECPLENEEREIKSHLSLGSGVSTPFLGVKHAVNRHQ